MNNKMVCKSRKNIWKSLYQLPKTNFYKKGTHLRKGMIKGMKKV